MGKYDDSVRGALGKEAWDLLIEKTEDGSELREILDWWTGLEF